MLKITKSSEPIHVKTLVLCAYGAPGVGKTSLAFTADRPLLLDFDRGSYRARNRRDVVQIEKWAEVAEMTAEDLKDYKTLIVDTAGRALDVLSVDIARNPKMARGAGALSLQGFGELRARFVAWTKLIRSFGLDIVLIAHSEESKDGDSIIERLDVQGGSKGEIYKSSDVMGRIAIINGRRMFNMSPTETSFGKDPGQLGSVEIPLYGADPVCLAGVIQRTKDSINAVTEEQAKSAALQAEWMERIGAAKTLEAINALLEPAKAADEMVRDTAKRMLQKAAKELGATFDKAAGAFVAPRPSGTGSDTSAKPNTTPPVDGANGPADGDTTSAAAPTERQPGDDTESEEEANRKAAEPTQAEIEKQAGKTTSKKAKAA